MSFKIDLHCHSKCSDGSLTAKELLFLAKQINLQGLSITDHDTMDAYNEDLMLLAKQLDLILIAGIEITSCLFNESIHILGYNFDLSSTDLQKFLSEIQKKKQERNRAILEKLKERKIFISEEELYSCFIKDINKTTIGRPHIALLMKKKGYISSIQEAFDKYFGDKGPCFVMGERPSSQEVIDEIHKAKGKAIIAHPSQIKNAKILREVLLLSFDGIEAYYSKLLLDQEMKWINIAKDKKWLITGGSDFHGDIRPHVDLGCSWISKEDFLKLVS
jgi:3',5'-nucleoside bisphosphate phosphatase